MLLVTTGTHFLPVVKIAGYAPPVHKSPCNLYDDTAISPNKTILLKRSKQWQGKLQGLISQLCWNSILKRENQNLHAGLLNYLKSLSWNKNLFNTWSPWKDQLLQNSWFHVTTRISIKTSFNIFYNKTVQVSLSELHWCKQQCIKYKQRLTIYSSWMPSHVKLNAL